MGWTEQEQLVVAMEEGTIRMYSLDGEYTQFSLGKVSYTLTLCKLKQSWTKLAYRKRKSMGLQIVRYGVMDLLP